MLPSPRAFFSPLLLLVFAGSTGVLGSRQRECLFPPRWEGTWFQSGVRQSIVISRNELSSKGRCLHNEGDKYLLVDQKSCYRCVVIHEKHSNVLQYKETYCHSKNSLSSLCSYITGDALLYSMFREEALPVPCPFRGPMTFSYNRGHGTCSLPQSNVDTCTDDSRLLFRYQACPDVPASESAVEELECLATWKEGSSRYLVGRLHHNHASSNEDRYRCFVYEKASQTVQGNLNRAGMGMAAMDHEIAPPSGPLPEGAPEIYRVAQSGDATCNGLFSPMEGSRTMTLKKVSSPGECRFPNWLTGHANGGLTWHSLDLARSYTFHPKNASLHVAGLNGSTSRFDSGGSSDGQYVLAQDDQDVKILCNSIKQSNIAQTTTMTMLVAHFTVGCRSGYMCMAFYRRDGHVVELQTGSALSRPDEACSPPHFQQLSTPYLTLVTSSPEPRQCPYLGKFTVTGVNRNPRNTRDSWRNQRQGESLKVRHAQERKVDLDLETRRANNEYAVHERLGRRARSNRNWKPHRDYEREEDASAAKTLDSRELRREHNTRSKARRASLVRSKRNPEALEDLLSYVFGSTSVKQFWSPDLGDSGTAAILEVDGDYFGDYPDVANLPKKRSSILRSSVRRRPYEQPRRTRRDLEEAARRKNLFLEIREKREEVESRCSSEVTTLTVGCSTADTMEFQSDCVDEEDAVTAYLCHGQWFDAEGTQFVIATPLARRSSPWRGEDDGRAQPYRNTRRLCFMYKESGGVVSLTASPVACQRGVPPPTPMLAFNATSTGQCMEENDGQTWRATRSTMLLLSIALVVFR